MSRVRVPASQAHIRLGQRRIAMDVVCRVYRLSLARTNLLHLSSPASRRIFVPTAQKRTESVHVRLCCCEESIYSSIVNAVARLVLVQTDVTLAPRSLSFSEALGAGPRFPLLTRASEGIRRNIHPSRGPAAIEPNIRARGRRFRPSPSCVLAELKCDGPESAHFRSLSQV